MSEVQTSAIENRKSFSFCVLSLVVIGFGVATLCWLFPKWPQTVSWVALGMEVLAFFLGVRARRHWPAKIALSGAALFFALTLRVSFFGPTVQRKIHPTAGWMSPLETTWELQSPGKVHSIRAVSDRQKKGEDSLRFEIRGGERWVDAAFETTYRSEIATREYAAIGSTKWYSFSVYFPEDFPIEGNRLVFAQWHSRIDLGDPGISPPLSFHFESGNLKIKLRHSSESSVRDPDKVPDERLFFTNEFRLGQWHDFVVQAKWSWQPDGLVTSRAGGLWKENRAAVQVWPLPRRDGQNLRGVFQSGKIRGHTRGSGLQYPRAPPEHGWRAVRACPVGMKQAHPCIWSRKPNASEVLLKNALTTGWVWNLGV
jgi:hypothetical protein